MLKFINNVIFENYDVKPTHIANLTGKILDEIRDYNITSSTFVQECKSNPLPLRMYENWVYINDDTLRKFQQNNFYKLCNER